MLSQTGKSLSPLLIAALVSLLLTAWVAPTDAVTRKKAGKPESTNPSRDASPKPAGDVVLELNFSPEDVQRKSIRDVTIEFEKGPLGLALRRLSAETGAGVVLMAGLEDYRYGPYTFEDATVPSILNAFAEDSRNLITVEPTYAFIHPPGSEVLNQWNLRGRLEGIANDAKVDIAVRASTPLYSALAMLSHSLDTTVVADNAIAEAQAGELHLYGASLETVLGALLRSARVAPTSVEFEKSSGYLLLRSRPARPTPNPVLNPHEIPASARAWLRKPIKLNLPDAPEGPQNLVGYRGSTPLKELLPALSEQLGVRVTATKDAGRLPINPMVARNIEAQSALNLIVHQWLVPAFGYEITEEGVNFRRR